jgi:hypothetical protein
MTLMDLPTTNGKDATGRFLPGHKYAKGNPLAKYVQRNRSILLKNAKPQDILGIFNALVAKAKEGDVSAAKEVFDRVLGKPADDVSRDDQAKVIQMFLTQVNQYAGAPPAKMIDSANAGAPMHTHDAQSSSPGDAG